MKIRPAKTAVFFISVLAANRQAHDLAAGELLRHFGEPSHLFGPRQFTSTSYYRDELGESPLKSFLGYSEHFQTELLPERKILTNGLEEELASRLRLPLPRPVNLDPGYLTLHNIVLASAKNFAHRLHLADGIYGEVTLLYRDKHYQALPWTFPDYASGEYFDFFLSLRSMLPHPALEPTF